MTRKKPTVNIITGASPSIPSNEGLLGQFIRERSAAYVPPERRGTPKGDPIGYSRERYNASLLMLTTAPLKDIAKKLNISYGVLRVWRTEKRFMEFILKHAKDFADQVFIPHIQERLRLRREQHDKALREVPIEELIKRPNDCVSLPADRMGDAHVYGGALISVIVNSIEELVAAQSKGCKDISDHLSSFLFLSEANYLLRFTLTDTKSAQRLNKIQRESSKALVVINLTLAISLIHDPGWKLVGEDLRKSVLISLSQSREIIRSL